MVHQPSSAALAPRPRLWPGRQVGRERVHAGPRVPATAPVAGTATAAASVVRTRARWDGPVSGVLIAAGLGTVSAMVFTRGIATPSPWSDEGATYIAIQRPWSQLAVLWRGPDAPWVPYYSLAKAWTAMLQAVSPTLPTLVAVRLLSAAAATATVLALYALVTRNAGRIGGTLAALVLLSLPGFSRYAQEARGYALLALAATLSWLLCDRWLRPGRRAGLTGSGPGPARPARPFGRLAAGGGYALSLAAVAAIHTFGLFQWPAHLIRVATAPGERSVQVRRLGWFAVIGLGAGALAAAQLTASLLNGTGPTEAQAGRMVTVTSIVGQVVRGISVTTNPIVSLPVLVLALVGLLARVDGRREFPASLLIWLATPLPLAILVGALRTNLFRLRYWIAFLPPLAALAGLGILAVATAVAQLVRRAAGGWLPGAWARGLAGTCAVAVVGAVLGAQVALTLPKQQDIRAVDGHGQDLAGVATILAETQSRYPGVIPAISSRIGSGMAAAVDPTVLARNPLRRIDPSVPTVYTSAVSAHAVEQALAGTHDVLWIHLGAESPGRAADHLPHALARLHPTVIWAQPAGPGWTAVLMRITA